MSFDWKKHSECFDSKELERWACKADRAAMIAEGERLQAEWFRSNKAIAELEAENKRLWARGVEAFDRVIALEKELMARRENEGRLREALEAATKSLEWVGRANLHENDASELRAYASNRGIVARAALDMSTKPENIDTKPECVEAENMRLSERLKWAEDKMAKYREALEGFAMRGIHVDTTPTNAHEWDVIALYRYLAEANAIVLSIARAALSDEERAE